MSKRQTNCEKKNSENQEIILAQWQTCVEMANSVSQRRDAMNNIFVTLNLAIIAAVSLIWDIKTIFVLTAGIVICAIWIVFVNNFKMLNKAKFQVINRIEQQLPFAPFKDEWVELKKSRKYRDGTKLEKIIPITFICLYLVAIVAIVIMKYFNLGGN